ncbi:serine/threonine-protein phosphatase 6 regulatory subunit 2 isoform X1 [Cinclus cinclus]|uniref:serine/threonine-protein phosphatase 6 regulatory subunit 2 isoform X1 n=1 Tax=Cinclus cinclus TaxID=127875 RepID=UPI002E149C5B
MFWKFDLNTTSHVDKLLDKEGVTLEELMDEDDILQECKAQNRRLLDFLCQQHCMEQLVTLITHEPPVDMDEKVRFKYPNTACELLTSDVPQINDKLGGDETLLNILYDFLDHEPPLNPLLASFFSKTIGNLIARKTEQVISFLRKKDKFLSLVLKHIDTSAMMDLLLRLISCVEPTALRQDVLNWLNEARIIQRLVELIHSSQDEDRQSNASQTLCDIIRLSRDQSTQLQDVPEPDPLLTALESQECVEQLLRNMFDAEQSETCIVNGTQVLLTLLETRRSGVEGLMDSYTQGFERSYTVNSSILHGIEPRLKDFHQLLLRPPKKPAILTTLGVLEEPLGNARLHGSRLIAALLHTNTPSINQELCRLGTMDLLLDLFFKYTWNNFLHFQVELSIAAILSHSVHEGKPIPGEQDSKEEALSGSMAPEPPVPSEPSEAPAGATENVMVTHLFQKCCLVQRILDAWEANDKIQAEGGRRRGNMGHLTRIANAVVHNMEKGPMQAQISDFIKELPEDCRGRWESFVEETLTETNRRNTVDLVSTHHLHSSSEDEDIESAFPNELTLQQAFSEYQIQQMTANFVDQFGFNDEEFADQDDNINAPFDRIAEINFNIDADDDSQSSSRTAVTPAPEQSWIWSALSLGLRGVSPGNLWNVISLWSCSPTPPCLRPAAMSASSSSMTMRRRRISGRRRRSPTQPKSSPGHGLEQHRRRRAPKVTWRTGTTTAVWTRKRKRSSSRSHPCTRAAPRSGKSQTPPKGLAGQLCLSPRTPRHPWPWTWAPACGTRPPRRATPQRRRAGPSSQTSSLSAAPSPALAVAPPWTPREAAPTGARHRARTRTPALPLPVCGTRVGHGRRPWWPRTAAPRAAPRVMMTTTTRPRLPRNPRHRSPARTEQLPPVSRRDWLWRHFPWDLGPPEHGTAWRRTLMGTREWPLLSQLPQRRPRETGVTRPCLALKPR